MIIFLIWFRFHVFHIDNRYAGVVAQEVSVHCDWEETDESGKRTATLMKMHTLLRSLICYCTLSGLRRALLCDCSDRGLIGRGLDEFLDLDTPVRVKDDSQTGCVLLIFLASIDRKHAGNLSKDADSMDRIDISYCIAIVVTILEQECPDVRLTALDHVLNCSNHNRVTHNECLVKTRK